MGNSRLKKTVYYLNLRKLNKPAALCTSALFIITVLSVFGTATVQAATQVSVSSATASSYSGAYAPNLAIDGIESTSNYWGTTSALNLPQWLQLDLGSQRSISQTTTHFYDGDSRTYTYYIQVSSDGSTWNTIVPTKTGSSIVTDTFNPITARYIRITITGNTANLAAHIEEIKIYQTTNPTPTPIITPTPTPTPTIIPTPVTKYNQIAVSSATASSYDGNHTPDIAIDGIESYTNYWGTNDMIAAGKLPQWLQLDLGTQTRISQITTHFYDAGSRTYTYYIQASTDGSTWNTIVPTKTGSSIVTDTFNPITARYIRITVTGNTANLAAHIEEIKIYQTTNPTPTPIITPTPTPTPTIPPLHVDGNKIKDIYGNIVYLRGVNRPEGTDSDGSWMGNTFWDDGRARTELNAIKSWGANVIRVHMSVDLWKYDTIDPTSSLHNREAIKRTIQLAAEQGMYVIFDGYSVMASNRNQDPLPYPPYQAIAAEQNVIANQQQFVNFMGDFANELKGYPNVIFEMWNEPHGDNTAKSSWFSTVQQCITTIRATGSQNLIIVQWDYGATVNLNYPGSANSLNWVFNYPLSDPAGNLVYSTHLYRSSGHIQVGGGYAYKLADVDAGLRAMGYYDVAQKYPLFVGETGAVLGGADQAQELEFFNNTLNLLNQHGINYCAWVWGNWGLPLNNGPPTFTPTASGNILRSYLKSTAQ